MKLTLMLMGGSALLMVGMFGVYYCMELPSGTHTFNLLELANVESGSLSPMLREFSLRRLTESLRGSFSVRSGLAGLSFSFDLDGEPKLVKAIYTGTNGTQEGADDIAALANQVKLLGSTLPLVLLVLGLVFLVVGLLLLRGGNKDSGTAASDEDLVPAAGSGASGTATQVLDDASQKPDSTT